MLRLAKRAVTEGIAASADAALANAERLYLTDLMSLADPQEGLAAWLEKRTPDVEERVMATSTPPGA